MFTRFLPLAALLLALPLAACGGDEAADDAATGDAYADDGAAASDAAPADAATTDAPDVDVPGTIAALESGLTAIPLADATANIDGWIATLEGTQFTDISASLQALRTDLQAESIDGAAVGAHLSRLGELTTEAATGASSSSQEGLMRLGELLSTAGSSLTGGA
ncbi:MAG: hypothetical protein AAFQ43_04995 [Bacteroidota bacterium]